MPDPIDLILKYLRPTASMPKVKDIAAPAVLKKAGIAMVTALGTLKIMVLDATERDALSAKDPIGQRQTSRAFVALGKKRPELARAAGVDLGTFQLVIHLDDAYDTLYYTLDQIGQVVRDGLLLVRAGLSEDVTKVLDYVRRALSERTLPPDDLRTVRISFNGVDVNASEAAQQEADNAARRQRDKLAAEATHAGPEAAGQGGHPA